MSIRVRIPSPLRNFTNGADVVEADGGTVAAVLDSLRTKAPGIETRLFKGPAQLNRFVNVFLNDTDVRHLEALDTPVGDRDTLVLLPAMAGG